MNYASVVADLAAELDRRCDDRLNLVALDGIPAGGKSSLAAAVTAELSLRGRSIVSIENDWFIARSIRNPLAIAWGLGMALSPIGRGTVEERLLSRFLDSSRLGAFQDQLAAAAVCLRDADRAVLHPQGAFWNLHDPRPWSEEPASGGLTLRQGTIVLIEGTLTTATYRPRFEDLVAVRLRVSPEVARERFLERNRDPRRRRNLAFSTLALTPTPLRLADQLLDRHDFDIELDLTCFEAPTLLPVSALSSVPS